MNKSANDNAAPATPTLDLVLAALRAPLPTELGWALAGWAHHLRTTTHPHHAANSHAKHAGEFDRLRDAAAALTVARCLDFGMTPADASALVSARVAARATKAA